MNQKILSRMALVLIYSAMFWQCADEGQKPSDKPINVTFSLDLPANTNGRTNFEKPTTLYISIANENGELWHFKKMPVLQVGNSYVSEPLSLLPGHYSITDFLLGNDNGVIQYATPKKGSNMENAVSKPLPYDFQVTKNEVNNIATEVVSIEAQAASDLGYAAFPIEIVNALRIAVFVRNNNNEQSLVSAKGAIVLDGDTINRFDLAATMNAVSFPGSPELTYTLVVRKPGYNIEKFTFRYDTLQNIQLQLYLDEALAMDVLIGDALAPFLLHILYHSKPDPFERQEMWVNWGDGSPIELTSYLYHEYATPGRYHITVIGDLDLIFGLEYFDDRPNIIEQCNFSALKNLDLLGITGGVGPAVVDVRQNVKLRHLDLIANTMLEHVYMPESYTIPYSVISGPTHMTTETVDALINTLYNAAVSNNTHNGFLGLYEDANNPGTSDFIAQPSYHTYLKLVELQDQYDWTVAPVVMPPYSAKR